MRFSIIVPAYNVEKYLSRCLDSVLAQTFRDFEIVVIDDGTPDRSGEIADEYHDKYPNLIRVIHQKNKGLGGARNTGIKEAKGEYLFFLDSDDYIDEMSLEILDNKILLSQADILFFNAIIFDEYGVTNRAIKGNNYIDSNKKNITLKEFLCVPHMTWNKIYKKELFIDNDVFFPERLWYEDLATTARVAYYAKSIEYIDEYLYFYFENIDGIMHSSNENKMKEIVVAYEMLYEFYSEKNIVEEYFDELEVVAIKNLVLSGTNRAFAQKYNVELAKYINRGVLEKFPQYNENKYLEIEQLKSKIGLLYNKKYSEYYFKYCIYNNVKKHIYAWIKKFVGERVMFLYRAKKNKCRR